jgi:hypothetical protein
MIAAAPRVFPGSMVASVRRGRPPAAAIGAFA